MDSQLKQKIEQLIQSHTVFLFMKGTPEEPQCGFSARVVELLQDLNISFGSFNVFDNESVREGVKEYAHWPTLPQLYINGKFIGGCDIVAELAEKGELQKLVGV